MDKFELFTGFVKFQGKHGGKKRPVLLLRNNGLTINYYPITTKFSNTSDYIKQFYYPIKQWQKTGLHKRSWIDVSHIRTMPKTILNSDFVIGELSNKDIDGMLSQIEQLYNHSKYN